MQLSGDLTPKLTIARPLNFPHHRSGWRYLMESLQPLLVDGGVNLDVFIEETFCWNRARHERSGVIPYRSGWVGFLHNPPGIPAWHEYASAPQRIMTTSAWIESQETCRGLFTFSEYMRQWLAARVKVPVAALIHPSETPELPFSLEAFLASGRPRIVQVGIWLRRMSSIALLPVTRLRKACLVPRPDGAMYLNSVVARERANDPAARDADWSTVEMIGYLDPGGFDELLARSVVFLDLHDSVVNNTVIECILRGTPLICNRLPSLVELLGVNYPLYFSDLKEAAEKADDFDLIAEGARYMAAIPKDCFTGEHFTRSLAATAIYRNL